MNKDPLLKEVVEFKNSVKRGGMFLSDYCLNKKRLIEKIECVSEMRLKIIEKLYFLNRIKKEQYIKHKKIIENERTEYKRILNFYYELL